MEKLKEELGKVNRASIIFEELGNLTDAIAKLTTERDAAIKAESQKRVDRLVTLMRSAASQCVIESGNEFRWGFYEKTDKHIDYVVVTIYPDTELWQELKKKGCEITTDETGLL